jgi:hypothetical protein
MQLSYHGPMGAYLSTGFRGINQYAQQSSGGLRNLLRRILRPLGR